MRSFALEVVTIKQDGSKMYAMLETVWRSVSWALRIGCCVHLIHHNVYEVTETQGESMLPTLNFVGDFVHANKLCRRGRGCEIGDMIIASKPTDPEQRVCKRITGMPGDLVLVDPSAGDFENYIKVPTGHCWVTGDNLSQSLDSRSYGVLPLALIKGKVIAAHSTSGEFRWIHNAFSDEQ